MDLDTNVPPSPHSLEKKMVAYITIKIPLRHSYMFIFPIRNVETIKIESKLLFQLINLTKK